MFGLVWRYFAIGTLLLVFLGFINNELEFLQLINNENYHPSVFWMLMATIYALIGWIQPKGVTYFLAGYVVKVEPYLWIKFNQLIVIQFLLLSLLSLVISFTVTSEIWALYKLFGQPFLLTCMPIYIAWSISRRINATKSS